MGISGHISRGMEEEQGDTVGATKVKT